MHRGCLLPKLFKIAVRPEPVPLALDERSYSPTLYRLDILCRIECDSPRSYVRCDRARQWVVAVGFERTHCSEKLLLRVTGHRDDVNDFGRACGERTGLIHRHSF